jgi:flavin-binding protein dodecin
MTDSVYKVVELIGTRSLAAKSLRGLRIAEVSELDLQLEENEVIAYRAKVKLSFKYEGE